MKNTAFQRFLSALCALVLTLTLVPAARAAGTPVASNNARRNHYNWYAQAVASHLVANASGGLTRVEALNNKEIVVEDYSPSFALLSQRKLSCELAYYGGFFAGQSYNFFVFGQHNEGESDSVEVVRVVKYDKNWNRLGHASLYGGNTTIPFRATSLRCAEAGGMLYIHTGHEMYASSDGKNHQANMNIVVRQSDMQITETGCRVGGYSNYVSHSFNQYIIADSQGNIVTANQGDAYPRALVIHKIPGVAGSGSMTSSQTVSVQTERFEGANGDNQTNVCLGGLTETSTGYLMAYTQRKTGAYSDQIKLAYISKDSFGNGGALQIRQLTNNPDIASYSSKIEANPVLAPTGPSGGWILWNSLGSYVYPDDRPLLGLRYAAYSADGSVGPVQKLNKVAPLSDCQPIYYNGKTVWYTTENSAPVFYSLDASGLTATPANGAPSPVTGEPERTPAPIGSLSFTDVPATHWAYDDIARAVSLGAVSGYDDGSFRPGSPVTLAEFALMLGRVFYPDELERFQANPKYAGKPWYVSVCDMGDATAYHWLNGPDTIKDRNNDFKVFHNIKLNRFHLANAANAVYNDYKERVHYTELEYLESQITDFVETDSIWESSRWQYALTCIHIGLLSTMPDGSFSGEKLVTRAEACAVINRLYSMTNS